MRNPNSNRRDFLSTSVSAGVAAGLAQGGFFSAPTHASENRKLGVALVGLGSLSTNQIAPAFLKSENCRLAAIVTGTPEKEKIWSEKYGIGPGHIYNYNSFDKLASDDSVDVVYIVLPNSMHAEYTIRGLKAGKHVLCEKPMAATPAECEKMIAAGKEAKRKLMIVYRLRYEPFNMTAIELGRKGEVGKIKTIAASNGQDVQAPNIRLSRELAGGPVGDVGIYCLNACRYLTGEEPVEVTAIAHQPKDDPRFREVPESVAFTLRFPSGAIGNCDCSFGIAASRQFRVQGSDGTLVLDPAFAYRGLRMTLEKDGKKTELTPTAVDHFAAEMDHLSECILGDKAPRTPGEEGLADMRVIAAIDEAAKTGKAVAVRK